jgi:multiple sugar transport system permease protein
MMALSVCAAIPILLLFIFFQKYMISGMTAGAVKG